MAVQVRLQVGQAPGRGQQGPHRVARPQELADDQGALGDEQPVVVVARARCLTATPELGVVQAEVVADAGIVRVADLDHDPGHPSESAHSRLKLQPFRYTGPVTTRWLDDDEQRTWRAFLAAMQLLSTALDRELQRDADMPHAYYEILVALSEAPGRTLRMNELAEVCQSSRSRLSHAVARLEEAGWVERASCPTDKRGSLARLTDAGFAALEAAAPGHVAAVRANLFDLLTPDQVRQLGQISAAVRDGIEAAGAAG